MITNLHPLLQRAETNGIHFEMQDAVAIARLSRPAKRNAMSDSLVEALRDVFQNLPVDAKAAVIYGQGDHFCAGLDLSELKERDAGEGMHHSRSWHVALDAIQFGSVPVGLHCTAQWLEAVWNLPARAIYGSPTTAPSMPYLKAPEVFLLVAVAR